MERTNPIKETHPASTFTPDSASAAGLALPPKKQVEQ